MTGALTAFGCIALTLASTPALAVETPESRAQSYIDDARATITANNARLKDRSIACDSTEAGEGGLKLARVDGLMQGLVNLQPRFPPYMQAGVSRATGNLGAEAGRLRLEQADGFLAAGCPRKPTGFIGSCCPVAARPCSRG